MLKPKIAGQPLVEETVVDMLIKGATYAEIALELKNRYGYLVSEKTIQRYMANHFAPNEERGVELARQDLITDQIIRKAYKQYETTIKSADKSLQECQARIRNISEKQTRLWARFFKMEDEIEAKIDLQIKNNDQSAQSSILDDGTDCKFDIKAGYVKLNITYEKMLLIDLKYEDQLSKLRLEAMQYAKIMSDLLDGPEGIKQLVLDAQLATFELYTKEVLKYLPPDNRLDIVKEIGIKIATS